MAYLRRTVLVFVLNGHFVWHNLLAEVIRLSGSVTVLGHRRMAEIEGESFGKPLYAQAWRFVDPRLKRSLAYELGWSLDQTLQDSLAAKD